MTDISLLFFACELFKANFLKQSKADLDGLCTEVESSRTDFEVLGLEGQVLGLEASSRRKLACPRLEDSTIF